MYVCMYVCMRSKCMYVCRRSKCVYVCMYVCRWRASSLRMWTSADSAMKWIMQFAETSAITCRSCKSIVCMYVCVCALIHTYIPTLQTHIVAAQYQREAAADHVQRSHGHHAQECRREEGRSGQPSCIHCR